MWSLSSGSFFSFFDDLKATALFTKELGLRAMSYNTYARRKNALMDGYAKEGESLVCLVCLEPGCLKLPFLEEREPGPRSWCILT